MRNPPDHIIEESPRLMPPTWVANIAGADGESRMRCSSFDPDGQQACLQPAQGHTGWLGQQMPSLGHPVPAPGWVLASWAPLKPSVSPPLCLAASAQGWAGQPGRRNQEGKSPPLPHCKNHVGKKMPPAPAGREPQGKGRSTPGCCRASLAPSERRGSPPASGEGPEPSTLRAQKLSQAWRSPSSTPRAPASLFGAGMPLGTAVPRAGHCPPLGPGGAGECGGGTLVAVRCRMCRRTVPPVGRTLSRPE